MRLHFCAGVGSVVSSAPNIRPTAAPSSITSCAAPTIRLSIDILHLPQQRTGKEDDKPKARQVPTKMKRIDKEKVERTPESEINPNRRQQGNPKNHSL
ncbi:hypothetical protein M5689_024773 [Euphorbia peplus]|nr:hypothetical protein M5689_024773 [Euphorbia peplus]